MGHLSLKDCFRLIFSAQALESVECSQFILWPDSVNQALVLLALVMGMLVVFGLFLCCIFFLVVLGLLSSQLWLIVWKDSSPG